MYSNSEKILRGSFGTIHFIGIGGIGMSGLAEILARIGYKVQGSDINENYVMPRLRELGIDIFLNHEVANIKQKNIELVVISSAIKQDNIELKYAVENNIPVIKRAEMLAAFMQLKTSIAIAGAHGKTTTTSLVACLLEEAGLEPTVINGGIINSHGTNAYLGKGEFLVAEADESDGSFLKLNPAISVITNIDPEHLDYYGNFENLKKAFADFLEKIPFYGFSVLCMDNEHTRELKNSVCNKRIFTYGLDNQADIMANNIKIHNDRTYFDLIITKDDKIIKDCSIPTHGRHNVLNSLAALCIAWRFNLSEEVIKNAFSKFQGVKRRFTKVGFFKEARVIDDYAHHPKEITVTIDTAKNIVKDGKVIAVFQPHRYSRLANLFDDFVKSLQDADAILIMDVYSAGEAPIAGASKYTLKESILQSDKNKQVMLVDDLEDLANKLSQIIGKNDLILCMGAGDITKYAKNLVEKDIVKI